MSQDDLGDRMKAYERASVTVLEGRQPIAVRIDGRAFSRFTRGLRRPYDARMSAGMINTTVHLVKHTGAAVGYTQSDEITLILMPGNKPGSEPLFGGKVQKLTSVLAGMATAYFMLHVVRDLPDAYADRFPHFDARVFNVPDDVEAANVLLWRTLDAERNAVQMVAHDNFSPKQMFKRPVAELRVMLRDEKNIDFDVEFPDFFRFGTFIYPRSIERVLTDEERRRIPAARRPPADQRFIRTDYPMQVRRGFNAIYAALTGREP